MDAFLATLSLIFSHSATALLLQIMNRLAQKSIHSGLTFVIKQPLNIEKSELQVTKGKYGTSKVLQISRGAIFSARRIKTYPVRNNMKLKENALTQRALSIAPLQYSD